MSRLREKDEPTPWEQLLTSGITDPRAGTIVEQVFGRGPLGIILCDGCGRWQDFPPPDTLDAMRATAEAAGWRLGELGKGDDRCPICTATPHGIGPKLSVEIDKKIVKLREIKRALPAR
jgi:hypothetical protein